MSATSIRTMSRLVDGSVERPFSHAVAFIPECRPDIITPAWFDWLKEIGYTGVYLENDPFQPPRSGNASQFGTLCRLISLYDLAWGDQRQRLRDWIALACQLAHERGMKVYLSLWEPRLPAEAWGLFPVEWRGRGGWDRPQWNFISWCLSVPEAVAAFEEMAVEAFRQVPGIDGLKMGTHDNDACLCNDSCPRCNGTPQAELTKRVFASLIRAIDRAGLHRPDFEYVPYTWWWQPEELIALEEKLKGRRTLVMSRSSWGLKQYWQGRELGENQDLALGLSGISDHFRKELSVAQGKGWKTLDMAPWGHSLEYFWLPYTPAPNRVAERLCGLHGHGSAGWFDYDCGGVYPGINTEIIRDFQSGSASSADELVTCTLARLYPPSEQAAAASAYALAEQALACRPVAFNAPDVANLSGRCTIEACIGLPFDPGAISGFDQGHRVWFFTPANFMTPGAIPTLLEMYTACAAAWEKADAAFAGLRGSAVWAETILPWEKQVVRAHLLCTRSALRFITMSANRLARGRGELDGDTERRRLIPLFEEELADAREFRELWLADRRLLDNSNIRLEVMLQSCVPWIPLDGTDPFGSKITWMEAEVARLQAGRLWDSVPAFRAEGVETSATR
ncbi:MAG: hypothetical protein RLZZ408_1620 [Verrucomicrobiota bacterium]